MSFPKPATTLALFFLLTAPSAAVVQSIPVIAQSTGDSSRFDLPESVSGGTVIRIDGSDSMSRLNQVLKQGFEEAYPDTEVQIAYSGTDAALAALESGDIDVAAVGRPLTDEEKARGLRETPVERHKIALIVDPNNPFNGSLTTIQFGQIFRGEVDDWSEVGGEPGPIRFVDRPETSDTRQAFRAYPVFEEAPFETGDTADAVPEDSTQGVISALGEDGLGYAIAEQVFDDPDVKIVPMHNTLPDDPRYPFSQPLTYVYRESPGAAAQAFLGYATAPINDAALEAARVEGAVAAADGADTDGASTAGDSDGAAQGSGDAAGATDSGSEGTADGAALNNGAEDAGEGALDDAAVATAEGSELDDAPEDAEGAVAPAEADRDGAGFPWWLLLLLGIPLLLWLLLRRRPEEAPPAVVSTTDADPMAAPPDPAVDPAIGTGTVAPPSPAVASTPEAASVDAEPTNNLAPAPGVAGAAPGQANLAGAGLAGAGLAGAGLAGAGIAGAAASTLPYGAAIPPVVPLAPVSREEGDRVHLTPVSPQTLRAEWDISESERSRLRNAGGKQMALRLHDVTGLAPEAKPHRTWQFPCLETETALDVEIPDAAATYEGELGYLTGDNRWLGLVRSLPVTPAQSVSGVAGPAAGLTAGAAAVTAAGVAAAAAMDEMAQTPVGTPTRLSLSPQLSNTIQADWTLSPQDQAEVVAQPNAPLLRLYDATGLDLVDGLGPLVGEYRCDKTAQSLQIPIAQGDRDYAGELGYLAADGQWVPLARSGKVRIVAPSTDDVTGAAPDAALAGPDAGAVAAAAAAAAMAVSAPTVMSHEPMAVPASEVDTGVAPEESPTESTVALSLPEAGPAIAQWTLTDVERRTLQQARAEQLELRVHDVTAIDLDHQPPHNTQTYIVSPTAHEQVVTVPVGDRDYLAELGYLSAVGNQGWTTLARSTHVYIPGDSPAVEQPGQVDLEAPGTIEGLPSEAMAGAAIAVGLGAVAPSEPTRQPVGEADVAPLTPPTPEPAPEPVVEVSRIILVPLNPQDGYAYWEISEAQCTMLREQGGRNFKLRVHDATGLDIDYQPAHHTMEFDCSETERDRHVPIPESDRDYIAEVGYTTDGGDWLRLIRSFHTWFPG